MLVSTLRQKTWRVRCYINGSEHRVVGFPQLDRDLSYWFGARPSTIEVSLRDIPAATLAYTIINVQVSVDAGTTWLPYFYGYAMPKSIGIVGMERGVTGVDVLYLLDKDASTEIVWNATPYLDAIEDILLDAGVPAANINLPDAVDDLVERATVTRTITTEDNLKSTMEELLKFGRYVLYVDGSGTVRMRKFSTVPEASASIKFSSDDKQSSEYGIARQKFTREVGRMDRIVRKVVVDAGDSQTELSGYWQTTSQKAADGTTISDSNDFCTTSAQCVELATDWGQDECRNDYRTSFYAPTDPGLIPGMCIEIKCALNDFPDFTPARVTKVSYQKSAMVVTISTNPRAIGSGDDGGEGLTEDGYDEVSAPLADFSYTIEREGDLYGLVLQDTSTSDSSTIASYSWSVTGCGAGYPAPALGTTANEMTVIDTLVGISITLTVTDANGNSDSVTKPISETEIAVYTRQLQAVIDGNWHALLDYDAGWFDITPDGKTAQIVPRASDTQYLFAAMSDGTIWRYDVENSSVDAVQVGSLSGTPADIAQGEAFVSSLSANVLIVAHGSAVSVTYNALNATPTWSTYGFASTVNAVGVNPYEPSVLFACAGNALYVSYDSGASWVAEVTGETGSTAIDFCSFPWSPGFAVLFNGYTSLANAVLPQQAEWGAVTPDGTLQSITPGLQDEVLRISSSAGELFLVAADGTVSETQDGTDLDDTDRIVRDGFYNEVTWIADNSTFGVGKQVADADVFSIKAATTGATSVGYARIISVKETPDKPVSAAVIWMESGSGGGAWIYRDSAWSFVSINSSYFLWRSVSVDNTDPNKIVAFGTYGRDSIQEFIYADEADYFIKNPTYWPDESPFWYSPDGGTTWKELRVMIPSGWTGGDPRCATSGNGTFIRDGKLYSIIMEGNERNNKAYCIYGGVITYNETDDVYEVDSKYVLGPYNISTARYNFIVAFCYAGDGAYGPHIAWATRGEGWERLYGYFEATAYDEETGIYTLSSNKRTGPTTKNCGASPDDPSLMKSMSRFIGHDGIILIAQSAGAGCGRKEGLCADYKTGNYQLIDLITPYSDVTLTMTASDKNDVLYVVEGNSSRAPYARKAVSPYSTATDMTELGYQEWYGCARNEQDGSRGRYVVLVSTNGYFAIYDADKDVWQKIANDAGFGSYMSQSAVGVFAE